MAWAEEQDKLTLEARLSLASPDVVFEELERLAAKPSFGRDGQLETLLVKRNQPLING